MQREPRASLRLQIIFGTGTVNKVFEAFTALSGVQGGTKEDVKQAAAAKAPLPQRLIKTLGDIFVPIIPAIVASGFLMGIMEALNFMVNNGFLDIDTSGSIYVFAQLFSNTAYTFLPILIGFAAAQVFGGNQFLGAVIGMIMIHPDLQNAWTVSEGVQVMQPVFGGLYEVPLVGYQGHVIPVIIAVWVMCQIEKRLHKVVPAMIDLFVTPLVSVFVTGYLTLAVIGPIFTTIENGIIGGVQTLITLPFGIGAFVMGGLYAITVVAGIHHMYTIIDLGQLAQYGLTYWLPLASAANMGQGGAALAVALKSRDTKVKSMALPSALSACMGITEPAIFGVNLRYFKPFLGGLAGGAEMAVSPCFELEAATGGSFALTVAGGLTFACDEAGSTASLWFAGEALGAGRDRRTMELQTPCRSVRVLADASSLEIFVNGGEAVFTTRYYPEPGPVTLRLEGAAGTVWPLAL